MAKQTRRMSNQLSTRKSVVTAPRHVTRIGRNDRCPCGSGKKYKDCHRAAGAEFLAKLAEAEDRRLLKEKRRKLKEQGVPWLKRLFVR